MRNPRIRNPFNAHPAQCSLPRARPPIPRTPSTPLRPLRGPDRYLISRGGSWGGSLRAPFASLGSAQFCALPRAGRCVVPPARCSSFPSRGLRACGRAGASAAGSPRGRRAPPRFCARLRAARSVGALIPAPFAVPPAVPPFRARAPPSARASVCWPGSSARGRGPACRQDSGVAALPQRPLPLPLRALPRAAQGGPLPLSVAGTLGPRWRVLRSGWALPSCCSLPLPVRPAAARSGPRRCPRGGDCHRAGGCSLRSRSEGRSLPVFGPCSITRKRVANRRT